MSDSYWAEIEERARELPYAKLAGLWAVLSREIERRAHRWVEEPETFWEVLGDLPTAVVEAMVGAFHKRLSEDVEWAPTEKDEQLLRMLEQVRIELVTRETQQGGEDG